MLSFSYGLVSTGRKKLKKNRTTTLPKTLSLYIVVFASQTLTSYLMKRKQNLLLNPIYIQYRVPQLGLTNSVD